MTEVRTARASQPRSVSPELLQAKLETVEARTDTKFAQLIGKLDLLGERLGALTTDLGAVKTAIDRVEGKTSTTRLIIVTTVLGAFIGVAALIYTLAQYSVAIAAFVKGQ